ncbi:MAG: translation initiation factor IF-2 [Deltaproteobacteria bacterium]|nr:translation initiation factor IF-2 [Deltaproteobacteria bacterium]
MSKKRVHELAKEYGLDTREVLQRLQNAGVDAKSHSSSVYEEEARQILGKTKADEAAEAAAASPRRPGMMIVKKRQDIKPRVETAKVDATVANMPVITAPVGKIAKEQINENIDTVVKEIEKPATTKEEVTKTMVAIPPEAKAEVRSSKPSTRASSAPVTSTQKDSRERKDNRHTEGRNKPSSTHGGPQEKERKHNNHQSRHQHGHSRNHGQQQSKSGGASQNSSTPSRSRPGVATVVRMIDREKLMERVPSRRLGGSSGGSSGSGSGSGSHSGGGHQGQNDRRPSSNNGPAQRFGQVTELKVVTDPFGRGREMINVGRDRKSKSPPSGKVSKKERAPSKRDLLEMRERVLHPARLKRKKSAVKGIKKQDVIERKASKRIIRMKESIIVADFAHQLGVKVTEIISKLMGLGMMITQNQSIDLDTATLLAAEYEYTVESTAFNEENALEALDATKEDEDQQSRPPVVTVMGHVDHGKTSLLDAIRASRIAAGEAGGITQHIGAYQVDVAEKGKITFLDTPGHAAFTSMRARGAQVTDIVVLVVAADDGVMPQTEEAVKHAQAAKVPIIVAVNKIDRPDAKPDRVMQELASKFDLTPEAWGGQTLYVNTSAIKGQGINDLLDAILLQAEVLELKASANRAAVGVVLEAKLDRGRGPVATVLVQTGTLKRSDSIVVGEYVGKVRAMQDDQGSSLDSAGPSAAVEITGIEGVPAAGDTVHTVASEKTAREIITHRIQRKNQEAAQRSAVTLEDMMKRMQDADDLEVKVILKADVQGSVEAVKEALLGLVTPEVKVTIVLAGVGGIKESDITLAAASKGIVVGFNVRPDNNARELAEREGVQIRSYNIIYEVIEDVRLAMQGLLAPETREKLLGHAEVREVFRITKVGQIAGCRLIDGKALRAARVRVLRDSVQIHDGSVSSLKHFKNDVREVDAGQECGVGVQDYNDIKVGDMLEFYQIEEIARVLHAPVTSGKRHDGGSGASATP